MPLSLDDLRKSTTMNRRDKRRKIVPTLIEMASEREIAADVGRYFQELAEHDRRQRDFSEQYLTERAGGDWKLARGLISSMLGFYVWEAETFEERLGREDWERWQGLGLVNPSALRLALYDYISAAPRPGFVGTSERAEALELFAAGLGLDPTLLDELLYLDAEEQARLRLRRRQDGASFRVPTVGEIVRRYNRMAVETLLNNSSEVIFGFGPTLPAPLVKRIGFLSKEFHIPYDLEYNSLGEVQLRLYGPVQAFGSPARHGEQLARLTFMTLALARRLPTEGVSTEENFAAPHTTLLDAPAPKRGRAKATTAPTTPTRAESFNTIRSTTARVHIKDKVYYFDVGAVAQYLAPEEGERLEDLPVVINTLEDANAAVGEVRERSQSYTVSGLSLVKAKEETVASFDSSVEARFYAEFTALAREGHTAGWQIEREPEALALPVHNLLFIPDFALQRGTTRVWLEIIGFWTPDYRLRKLEKLDKLKGAGDYRVLLAAANELKSDYLEGPHGEKRQPPFPTIFYKNSLRATEVVNLLQREYDDRAGRLNEAVAGRDQLEAQLEGSGFVPEESLYKTLRCYNKNELLAALQKLAMPSRYLDSYGLCSTLYLEGVAAALEDALLVRPRLSLEEASQTLTEAGLTNDNGRIEALLAGLPRLVIVRPSLFEVYVQHINTPVELAMPIAAGKARRGRR